MDEKLKIFWNLDALVKMCRSKSDGPSLRVEEEEILEKIKSCQQDVEEIKTILEEDTYDTSAEMADRNIEIITKKQLQSLKSELKEQQKELNSLKDQEKTLYGDTSILRENKTSNDKYIASMQERLSETTDREILDRYNALITETITKVNEISEELKEQNKAYEDIQNKILEVSASIENLEDNIDKKKKLLAETQANLESKENYVDKTKKEKNTKKIEEITEEIKNLENRLEEIRKDPKYIETKIKDIINSKEDVTSARDYLQALVKIVIDQPYINVPADNALEEELLRATQARDSFANEIDQKSYNILEANTPEKVRTEFLNKRIESWKQELARLHEEIEKVDKDSQFNYEKCDKEIAEMIESLKSDLKEFEKAYADTPENNIGLKASLEVALEEKREDIVEAEKIANLFKLNEAEDIATATRTIKYQCEQLNTNIEQAEAEIKKIRNRLMSKKSGLIDIATRNKDKDILRDLAQTVIDIKHRRQCPETPLDIITRLEEELGFKILDAEDYEKIKSTNSIGNKNYAEMIEEEQSTIEEVPVEERDFNEVQVINPEDMVATPVTTPEEQFQRLANQAMFTDEDETDEVPSGDMSLEEEMAEITGGSFMEPNTAVENQVNPPVEEREIAETVEEYPIPEEPVEEEVVNTVVSEPVVEETPVVEPTPIQEEVPEETEEDFSINSLFNKQNDTNFNIENETEKENLKNDYDRFVNDLDANR